MLPPRGAETGRVSAPTPVEDHHRCVDADANRARLEEMDRIFDLIDWEAA